MTAIRLEHDIHCDPETFWAIFFDEKLNAAIYKHGLDFPEMRIESFKDEGGKVSRKLAAQPRLKNLPGPVTKLLGSNFKYIEEGSMDRAEGVWRFKLIPNTMADKLRQEGSMRITPVGEKKVKRVVEVVVEAKIFAIGGLVEGAAEKTIREAWDTSAKYMNEWIEGKHRDLVT